MKWTSSIAAIATAVMAGHAQAESIDYTYIEAAYLNVDRDFASTSEDGFALRGSWRWGDAAFLFGEYADRSASWTYVGFAHRQEFRTHSAGLGYRLEVAPRTDLFARASYERLRCRIRNENLSPSGHVPAVWTGSCGDVDGYALATGARHLLAPRVEVNAEARYMDVPRNRDTELRLGAVGQLFTNFALVGSYTLGSNADGFSVGGRLSF